MITADGSQLPSLNGDSEANARNIYDYDNLANTSQWYIAGNSDNDDAIFTGPNEDSAAGAGTLRWRHSSDGATNMLFLDGHAETLQIGSVLKKNIRLDN